MASFRAYYEKTENVQRTSVVNELIDQANVDLAILQAKAKAVTEGWTFMGIKQVS